MLDYRDVHVSTTGLHVHEAVLHFTVGDCSSQALYREDGVPVSQTTQSNNTHIGVLNEQPLHAALKRRYASSEAALEVGVDGFVVDVVRDGLLLEIQTGNFSSIKAKLTHLAAHHPLRLVYPIAREKWLLKLPKKRGGEAERRKSPKRGRVEEVFKELVSFPELLCQETFSLEVLMIQEEEVRRFDPKRGWRQHGWVTVERRLLGIVNCHLFRQPVELGTLLPANLCDPFTTADLADVIDASRSLAQKMAYCLRRTAVIEQVGTRGRSKLYAPCNG